MAWLNYCDTQNLLPAALCAAAAHELGHLAAIWAAGGQVSRLRLTAVGAELRLEGTLSYGRELLCALAGPLVNLLLALEAARLGAVVFAGLNLVLGLFNLLPVSALDGGRALSCLTALLLGPERARQLLVCIDTVLAAALLACGSAVLETGGSVTLLLVAVWMLCGYLGQRRRSIRCAHGRPQGARYKSAPRTPKAGCTGDSATDISYSRLKRTMP